MSGFKPLSPRVFRYVDAGTTRKQFMSVNLKYIRFAGLGFVVFPDSIYHKNMAAGVGHRPISAGFITWSDGKPVCYGESLSLQLAHDPGDTQALHREWGMV